MTSFLYFVTRANSDMLIFWGKVYTVNPHLSMCILIGLCAVYPHCALGLCTHSSP